MFWKLMECKMNTNWRWKKYRSLSRRKRKTKIKNLKLKRKRKKRKKVKNIKIDHLNLFKSNHSINYLMISTFSGEFLFTWSKSLATTNPIKLSVFFLFLTDNCILIELKYINKASSNKSYTACLSIALATSSYFILFIWF